MNLPHGERGVSRLVMAAGRCELARVDTLIARHADVHVWWTVPAGLR